MSGKKGMKDYPVEVKLEVVKVLDEVWHAISAVWSNDKRIVVAVHTSFLASQSSTFTITPAQPTDTVTQVMIDSANAWAQETLEFLVTNAVINQIKQMLPGDIADFQINVL
jgi:hypothetical protein